MVNLKIDFDHLKSLDALLEELMQNQNLYDEELRIFSKANELVKNGAYPISVLHRLEISLRYMDPLSPSALIFREHLPQICEQLFHSTITPGIFKVSPL